MFYLMDLLGKEREHKKKKVTQEKKATYNLRFKYFSNLRNVDLNWQK